jgi:eukaryotic-like serine/threonine-protein kinase
MSEQDIPQLKNYNLIEEIVSGGMGTVYRGVDMVGRDVAVKVIHPHQSNRPDFHARFLNEGKALAKLGEHNNIVYLNGMFAEDDGRLFIVMQFVEGEDLDRRIRNRGLLPAETALPIFWQTLQAIDYAHGFGVIHRDIKPSNILVEPSGRVQVMDFGIAFVRGGERVTIDSVPGTPEYMAPELFNEESRGADELSDIYALGVTLYEIMTATVPFESKATTTMAAHVNIAKRHQSEDPPKPRSIYPFIDEGVEQVILKALVKNPLDRYQTVAEFIDAVEEQAENLEISLVLNEDDNKRKTTPTPRVTNPPKTPPPMEEPEVDSQFLAEDESVEVENNVPAWVAAVVWLMLAGVGYVVGSQLLG